MPARPARRTKAHTPCPDDKPCHTPSVRRTVPLPHVRLTSSLLPSRTQRDVPSLGLLTPGRATYQRCSFRPTSHTRADLHAPHDTPGPPRDASPHADIPHPHAPGDVSHPTGHSSDFPEPATCQLSAPPSAPTRADLPSRCSPDDSPFPRSPPTPLADSPFPFGRAWPTRLPRPCCRPAKPRPPDIPTRNWDAPIDKLSRTASRTRSTRTGRQAYASRLRLPPHDEPSHPSSNPTRTRPTDKPTLRSCSPAATDRPLPPPASRPYPARRDMPRLPDPTPPERLDVPVLLSHARRLDTAARAVPSHPTNPAAYDIPKQTGPAPPTYLSCPSPAPCDMSTPDFPRLPDNPSLH